MPGKGLVGVLLVFVPFFGTHSKLSQLRKAEGNIKKKRKWAAI